MTGGEEGVEGGEGGREGEGGEGEEQDDPESVSVNEEVWLQHTKFSVIKYWRLREREDTLSYSVALYMI